jgi:hypothetical protein
MARLVMVIASLACCCHITAQNLVMNPLLKDLNECCEFGIKDRAEAWYTAPEILAIKEKNNQHYIPVNPIHHTYDIPAVFCIVALYANIDSLSQYKFEVIAPGNSKIKIRYGFIDSSIVFNDAKAAKDSILKLVKLDSLILNGKRGSKIITPRTGGNYLIFMFQNEDPKITTTYGQHLRYIGITPVRKSAVDIEALKQRKQEVYDEDRSHYFNSKCPGKTLNGKD